MIPPTMDDEKRNDENNAKDPKIRVPDKKLIFFVFTQKVCCRYSKQQLINQWIIKAPQALHNTPPLLGAPKVIL